MVTAWMELKNIILSEISQVVKDKYHIIYKWNLINKTNKQNRARNMAIRNYLTVTRGVGKAEYRERRGRVKSRYTYVLRTHEQRQWEVVGQA